MKRLGLSLISLLMILGFNGCEDSSQAEEINKNVEVNKTPPLPEYDGVYIQSSKGKLIELKYDKNVLGRNKVYIVGNDLKKKCDYVDSQYGDIDINTLNLLDVKYILTKGVSQMNYLSEVIYISPNQLRKQTVGGGSFYCNKNLDTINTRTKTENGITYYKPSEQIAKGRIYKIHLSGKYYYFEIR
jgi:hypothetical protein